jgi:hypothetical protein
MSEINNIIIKLLEINTDYQLLFKITEVFTGQDTNEIRSLFIDVVPKYNTEILLQYAKELKQMKDKYDDAMGGPFAESIKRIIKKHIKISEIDEIFGNPSSSNNITPINSDITPKKRQIEDNTQQAEQHVDKKQKVAVEDESSIVAAMENKNENKIDLSSKNLIGMFRHIISIKQYILLEKSKNMDCYNFTKNFVNENKIVSQYISKFNQYNCNIKHCYYLEKHKVGDKFCTLARLQNVKISNICYVKKCVECMELTSTNYNNVCKLLTKPLHIKNDDTTNMCTRFNGQQKSISEYYRNIQIYLSSLLSNTNKNINFDGLLPIYNYRFIYDGETLLGYIR